MGMEIALIPAAMFIMGIGMMIYMKKKRYLKLWLKEMLKT